ncbi:MAG: methyltransferase domain-containing protein [Gracilimonas sp.]|uniref:class I SAM-dependent methyltransferase n=1 Tax=Gracilimonas sp. TaxID=1974203 RepID=UPI0019985161|nr:methyltransferase domain-containing protein [Gracilimonas sp.]MBD3615672.1 methyltransferase domain-containing protein [Gracilimonas sp.]
MYEFHKDKSRYFDMQYKTGRDYILPFITDLLPRREQLHILEIGCAEAGVLKAFTELGHKCVGIELSEWRTALAKKYMQKEIREGLISFLNRDILEINPSEEFKDLFDVVILKDVIEHINNQEEFIKTLKKFIDPDGIVFFGFPPWYMPFGGHQQIAHNKWLSKLPYFHLLPKPVYKWVLKIAGEPDIKIQGLLEIKETGISIERFEKIVKSSGWKIEKKKYWLFNPIYKWKFGVKARRVFPLFSSIPFIRNFWTSAIYYAIKQRN